MSVANNFAQYFSHIYTPNSSARAVALREEYGTLLCVLIILAS